MAEPNWREIFIENWKYDRWANSAWLETVDEYGNDEEKRLLGHILSASKVWVTRLGGTSLPAMPEIPLTQKSIDQICQSWIYALGSLDFDKVINYKNTQGEPHTSTVGDIVRQAQSHGTYHRGQLRHSFGARGVEYPETDFILYSSLKRDGQVK